MNAPLAQLATEEHLDGDTRRLTKRLRKHAGQYLDMCCLEDEGTMARQQKPDPRKTAAVILDQYRELIPEVVGWTESPGQWVRRGATVAFVPHARKGKHLATAYRIASRLFGDQEDLMHKAVGCLLREAEKTDMERLKEFLLKNGPKIPRTTVRYAIERFPKSQRKRLLEETRPKR